ncbi:MAG: hypothetical protein GXO47_06575 [Chlorobi bacterium]|nr:hypothetical protein [Chlorobiota bacterium]
MEQLIPQKASVLAIFSAAENLSLRLRRSLRKRGVGNCKEGGSVYIKGLYVSDNITEEFRWRKQTDWLVKFPKQNTESFIIFYSFVKPTGKIKVPFFCN